MFNPTGLRIVDEAVHEAEAGANSEDSSSESESDEDDHDVTHHNKVEVGAHRLDGAGRRHSLDHDPRLQGLCSGPKCGGRTSSSI